MTRVPFPEIPNNEGNGSIDNKANGGEDLEAGNNQRDKLFPTHIDSSVKLSSNVKVLIQTGGCIKWKTKDIPNNTIGRYLFDSDGFHYQGSFPDANMGNADTLEDFLRYGKETVEKEFKPDHRMFIFWNHGTLVTVCMDRRYSDSSPLKLGEGDGLDLNEIRQAFSKVYKASPNNPPFEIIGFDACVRATYENANNIYGFAKYMVASEENEPGCGWYYSDWIEKLSDNPSISGKNLSEIICQSSFNYLVNNNIPDAPMSTFSAIDLSPSKWLPLRNAYDSFMKNCYKYGTNYVYAQLIGVAEAKNTKNYYNKLMLDLKTFAENIKEHPVINQINQSLIESADDLINAVDSVVVCNKHNENRVGNNGISFYNSFLGDNEAFEMYASQNTISKHTKRLCEDLLRRSNVSNASDNLNTNNVQETSSRSTRSSRRSQKLREMYDMSEFHNFPVSVDKDNNEIIMNLNQDQMKKVSNIVSMVSYADIDNIDDINENDILKNAKFLGEDGSVQIDWNNGKITAKLNPTWTMLNGHLVYTEILESVDGKVDAEGKVIQKGYTIYGIPIEIERGGTRCIRCTLRVVYYPDNQEYKILGAKRITEGYTMSSRESIILKKGDKITPLFENIVTAENIKEGDKPEASVRTNVGDFAIRWIKGDSFKLEDDAVVHRGELKKGYGCRVFYFLSLQKNRFVTA